MGWCGEDLIDLLVVLLEGVLGTLDVILEVLLAGVDHAEHALLLVYITLQLLQMVLHNPILLNGRLPLLYVPSNPVPRHLHILHFYLPLLPDNVLPVGIAPIQLVYEILLLLLQILAHLQQSLGALLVLLHGALDILQKILIPRPALNLLYFNSGDFLLKFLGPD